MKKLTIILLAAFLLIGCSNNNGTTSIEDSIAVSLQVPTTELSVVDTATIEKLTAEPETETTVKVEPSIDDEAKSSKEEAEQEQQVSQLTAPVVTSPTSSQMKTKSVGIHTIAGSVSLATVKVEVSNEGDPYLLKKFVPNSGKWEYKIAQQFWNLRNGTNYYWIVAIDKDGNRSSATKFTIVYEAPKGIEIRAKYGLGISRNAAMNLFEFKFEKTPGTLGGYERYIASQDVEIVEIVGPSNNIYKISLAYIIDPNDSISVLNATMLALGTFDFLREKGVISSQDLQKIKKGLFGLEAYIYLGNGKLVEASMADMLGYVNWSIVLSRVGFDSTK